MYKTYKVMLVPNNKQITRFFRMAGAARYIYNWVLAEQRDNYKNGKKFIRPFEMMKRLTKLKELQEYSWLNEFSRDLLNQAITDACNAFIRFFERINHYPKFKSKRKSKPSFANKYNKIKISATHVTLEKISLSARQNKKIKNRIRLAEKGRIPTGEKIEYYNPRIYFDGLNWWLSVSVKVETNKMDLTEEGIGIDLGVVDLAVTSENKRYANINRTDIVIRLEKKLKRLQRQLSKKFEMNKVEGRMVITKNINKLKLQILKLHKRLRNIRLNHIRKVINEIINRKPRFIAMEDLNVKLMMKNKHRAKQIQRQCFFEFRNLMEFKCKLFGIKFILVNRYFPSSKKCSQCKVIKKDLKGWMRTFKCICGNTINRDYHAAINLKEWAINKFNSTY
ncbi:RNA-guided endonuclease TnpB family protein [Lysinibacillus sp. ZYM-1]|uniref:RNA-guided endonuclease InsQ/TnpB family protein n=1 Tax=Lysinibacillus sp. ZYM-1 TaxID=1681184 RepID=UPI0006CE7C1A|nr:RNA-guided endonuclease TnpB family protein [Lysinibacillus sp. ZYM-1]KPN89514.1 transposase [Lysinibacillus sp. ZYM-1]